MIDYSDPCSFAPCGGTTLSTAGINCNTGCTDNVVDDQMSMFSGSTRRSTAADNKLTTHPMTPRGLLMSRISDFQVKGWLSQQEHRKYSEMLLKTKKEGMEEEPEEEYADDNNVDENQENNNNSNIKGSNDQKEEENNENKDNKIPTTTTNSIEFLKNLEKELDKMEMKHSGGNGTILQKTMRIANILTPKSYLSTPRTERPHGLSVFPEPKSASAGYNNNNNNKYDNENAAMETIHSASMNDEKVDSNNNQHQQSTSNGGASVLIVEPKDLCKTSDLSHAEIEELFVEMCFFARLGFVQPPCCLKCTYRESMKDAIPNTMCKKWVVWRKSANLLLHPKQMDGNIVVVQCHAARKLLSGESVDNHVWDKTKKLLVHQATTGNN